MLYNKNDIQKNSKYIYIIDIDKIKINRISFVKKMRTYIKYENNILYINKDSNNEEIYIKIINWYLKIHKSFIWQNNIKWISFKILSNTIKIYVTMQFYKIVISCNVNEINFINLEKKITNLSKIKIKQIKKN